MRVGPPERPDRLSGNSSCVGMCVYVREVASPVCGGQAGIHNCREDLKQAAGKPFSSVWQ